MKKLIDIDFIVNEVFYKCWHILDFIQEHSPLSELDRMAIQATIMDALVYKGLIDSNKESLDLDNLCIVEDLEHYRYEEFPDVCGIPQWMKEEFRKKSIFISGGIPVSLFLAKPPGKSNRYCVFDPNTAVSSIFSDATFYLVTYISPTRNIEIEEPRPFVEVNINGELYLVDTLTKRIFKSSYFKERYGFKIEYEMSVSKMRGKKLKYYKNSIKENYNLSMFISLNSFFMESFKSLPTHAEMVYEFEKSKEYFPEEWAKYEEERPNIQNCSLEGLLLAKKGKNDK